MLIRTELKKRVPRQVWPFLRKIDKLIIYFTYIIFSIRRSYQRKKLYLTHPYPQSVPIFSSKIQFNTESGCDVETILSSAGLVCQSGRHSVYIGRKADICRINDDITKDYPANIGLKIIKSRQLAPDNTPYYTSTEIAPASTYWSMTAVGSMEEKKAVANLLYTQGVAPRFYDLIKIQSENNSYHYAFVVEHINGSVLHGREGEHFISHFKEVLSLFGMDTISITEHSDLRPPLFRNNIICGTEGARYVDIQNFVLSDLEIVRTIERDFLLYFLQSSEHTVTIITETESGRLDWESYSKNVDFLSGILECNDISINDSVIFTQSNLAVFFLPYFLHRGAFWVHILEPKNTALNNWIFLNGFTRFSFGVNTQAFDWLFQAAFHTKLYVIIIDKNSQIAANDIIELFDYILVFSNFAKSKEAINDMFSAYGFCLKFSHHFRQKFYVHLLEGRYK